MENEINGWLQLLFRWLHVIAGIMWIGHLWFFNFVNAQVAKTYDPDSKKKVVPELMPRALYWFRWGALYTLVTGLGLLVLLYYMGGPLTDGAIGIGLLVAGFAVYDLLWKALAKREALGTAISLALVTALAFGLSKLFVGRTLYIEIGALFGTIMAANVWMRIWPNQRHIIAAIRDGKAPDPARVALAGLRSKHNTYLSMPLTFFMISNHYPTVYGADLAWAFVPAFAAVGFVIARLCFVKSATQAPAAFQPLQKAV
jgi:uncharacterized membrane protein